MWHILYLSCDTIHSQNCLTCFANFRHILMRGSFHLCEFLHFSWFKLVAVGVHRCTARCRSLVNIAIDNWHDFHVHLWFWCSCIISTTTTATTISSIKIRWPQLYSIFSASGMVAPNSLWGSTIRSDDCPFVFSWVLLIYLDHSNRTTVLMYRHLWWQFYLFTWATWLCSSVFSSCSLRSFVVNSTRLSIWLKL